MDQDQDQTFRFAIVTCAVVLLPVMLYYRVRSQATGEPLDRRQEGLVILLTLRPLGLATMAGLIAYMVNPRSMTWSSMNLPAWGRWVGVGLGVVAGGLIVWTFHHLGKNLTDTVVTRRNHTLVLSGPYRWVRHPFYGAVALGMLANGLAAANWFILSTGTLVVVLLIVRTRIEEQKLLLRFGESYRTYMERTGRFLPKMGS